MTHWFANLSDMRKAILFSLAVHLLLFLIFLFWRVGIDFSPAEFVQVSFISSGRSVVPPQHAKPTQQENIEPAPLASSSAEKTAAKESPVVPVSLPQRPMLEEEKPVPIATKPEKLTPGAGEAVAPPEPVSADRRDYTPQTTAGGLGERVAAQPMENGEDRLSPPVPQSQSGEFSRQPYTIEGEAARRTIIRQEIPPYPAGLQKEAVVKIRFTVLADGTIGRMIPVLKGDPVLDELTMTTLRKWRFNPIPESEQTRDVQGVITFRYELQ
ncbi:MAG TPA: TonB family protein [bacterium]|nr:TonB family protein [bacterium]HNT64577.1 TonB family protein [bacterium]